MKSHSTSSYHALPSLLPDQSSFPHPTFKSELYILRNIHPRHDFVTPFLWFSTVFKTPPTQKQHRFKNLVFANPPSSAQIQQTTSEFVKPATIAMDEHANFQHRKRNKLRKNTIIWVNMV